jgi:Fic family protein
MDKYVPPITITENIINLVAEISELIGIIHVSDKMQSNPRLRRNNRIKTIHSSLAIENNTLSLEQVTAIVNGKRVLGTPAEIQEVKNAFEAYEHILELNPYNINDLLKAHGMMTNTLVAEAGVFRSGGVGVFVGDKLIHMAPPADLVSSLVSNLLNWTKTSELNMLIKSCVFHYEFEFIHPFQDGNGRMGRLWQTLLLSQYKPLFVYLPIETLIKARQQGYYDCLAQADSVADSSIFVEFLLQVIYDALKEFDIEEKLPENVKKVLSALGNETMSAKELMDKVGLSHLQTFRNNYLNPAIKAYKVGMTEPDNLKSKNQKYFKK